MIRSLEQVQQELEERIVRGSDIVQTEKLKGAAKSENNYEIGSLLNELRNHYSSDDQFGKACGQLWEEIAHRNPNRKIPARRTTFNLRKLPEFGELYECEMVGLTNVYKLMEEQWEPLRNQVKEITSSVNMHDTSSCKEVSKNVKDMCKEAFASARPQTFDEETVRELIERARGSTSPEERTALRQEGEAKAYYKLLGIDVEDFEGDEKALRMYVKMQLKRDLQLFHPDKCAEPDKFKEHFERTMVMKDFFGV